MANSRTELERTVIVWRDKGLIWVDAKLKSDQLDKGREPLLASIINRMRKSCPDMSEKQLDSESKGSAEYRDYIKGMVLAKHAELRAKIDYDFLEKLFSARQSDQSLEREKIQKGIFHTGQ